MVYFISIFFPFIGLFFIKKPVMGYFSLVAHLLILLGHSLYPTPLIIFLLWIFLVLWTFFEINDYRTKRFVNKITKILSAEESLATRNSTEDESFLSQSPDTSLLDLPMDQNRSLNTYPLKSNVANQNLGYAPIEQESSILEKNSNDHSLGNSNFDPRFYPASNEKLQENNSYYARSQDTYMPYSSSYSLGGKEESYSNKDLTYNDSNSGNINNRNRDSQRVSNNHIDNNYQNSGGIFATPNQVNAISRDLPNKYGSQINPISYGRYKLNSLAVEEQAQNQNVQKNKLPQRHRIDSYNQNNFVKSNTVLPPKQNHLAPSQGTALYKNYNKSLEQESFQGEFAKREKISTGRGKIGGIDYSNTRSNILSKPMVRGFVSRETLKEDQPEEVITMNYPRNNSYNVNYRNRIIGRR